MLTIDRWKKHKAIVQLNKSNKITLPKPIRLKYKIIPGREIVIAFNAGEIFIRNNENNNSFDNQVAVYSDGSFYFPIEIRRQIGIECETKFEIYTCENMIIKLVPINNI